MTPTNYGQYLNFSSEAQSLVGVCSGESLSSSIPPESKQSTRKNVSMKQKVTKSLTLKNFNIGYHKSIDSQYSSGEYKNERFVLLSSRNFRRECWDLADKIDRTSSHIRNVSRPGQLYEYRNWLLAHVTSLAEVTNAWADSVLATRKLGRPDIRKGHTS